MSNWTSRLLGVAAIGSILFAAQAEAASVWKVTGPRGGTLYVGGSVHALRSVDYPLPPAFNRAFDASARLIFEVDEKALTQSTNDLVKAARYAKGDSLKNHVDPRTYDYVKRVFGLMKVPESKFAVYRPWFLVLMLQSPGSGFVQSLGVEQYLMQRARANSKPITGLESVREHAEVFSGLSDRQSETLLLLTFIPQEKDGSMDKDIMDAWRRGDVDALAGSMYRTYREMPSFARRLLDDRNRRWMPKIEAFLGSGKTCFVVVGAAHLGGPAGVLNLLKAKGYEVSKF